MAGRILDTSYLIRHWNAYPKPTRRTVSEMRSWAEKLVGSCGTRLIVTPVYIEMVAGARNSNELELTRAFLDRFKIADEGKIPKEDCEEAKRIAQRVPSGGKPRHLGDCLVRAIANRLKCEVLTGDTHFPSR